MYKLIKIYLIIVVLFISLPFSVLYAEDTATSTTYSWTITPDVPYKLEAALPGKTTVNNLVDYLTTVYNLALSLVGILSTVMIIYGGFRWAASAGNDSAITAAKETITGALIGLIIAVGSYTILNFINPQLVSLKSGYVLKIPVLGGGNVGEACNWYTSSPSSSSTISDDSKCSSAGAKPNSITRGGMAASIQTYKCYCAPSICTPPSTPLTGDAAGTAVASFASKFISNNAGHLGYVMGGKDGKPCAASGKSPGGEICFDCSGFVTEMIHCGAGIKDYGSAIDLTKSSNVAKVNSLAELKPGGIYGWENTGKGAHVVLYIGNNTMCEFAGSLGGVCRKVDYINEGYDLYYYNIK